MSKISKAKIHLELEFLEGIEHEGFSVYDALHYWARQVSIGLERDQTIFLGQYTCAGVEPFVELKPLSLKIPGRSEHYVSTKDDEQQYRCSDPRKVSQAGFARFLLAKFDISYEYACVD